MATSATTPLRVIKLAHTVVWAVFASAIVALPIAALRGAFRWAFGLIALVSLEVAVLALNRWSCPLTAIAARHTSDRQPNFDIYLPVWLARWNKVIFGLLFLAGVAVTILSWHAASGLSRRSHCSRNRRSVASAHFALPRHEIHDSRQRAREGPRRTSGAATVVAHRDRPAHRGVRSLVRTRVGGDGRSAHAARRARKCGDDGGAPLRLPAADVARPALARRSPPAGREPVPALGRGPAVAIRIVALRRRMSPAARRRRGSVRGATFRQRQSQRRRSLRTRRCGGVRPSRHPGGGTSACGGRAIVTGSRIVARPMRRHVQQRIVMRESDPEHRRNRIACLAHPPSHQRDSACDDVSFPDCCSSRSRS